MAILAADVAGYSRLMNSDEEGTLRQLKEHRRALVDPSIAEHRGRIVKTTGDGLLLEFASAVDAVRCAVEVQRAMRERNAAIAPERRIEFRIGINVGDIIIDSGDIFGDGVNVAARLENFADSGEICVSDRVREDVENRLDVVFNDLGPQMFKNISQPVHVFGVDLQPDREVTGSSPDSRPAKHAGSQSQQTRHRKASLGVLPFTVFAHDAESEFLADGLVEDILTALARFRLVSIIARNSTFAYQGQQIDVRRAGSELGATYILEGSVRRSGDSFRITAQLIDATNGAHLWAERYDRRSEGVFAVQDEIAQAIVSGIEQPLVSAENRRGAPDPAGSTTDVVKAAGWHLFRFDRASNDTAIAMLLKAVEENPGAYRRQQALAMGYCWQMAFGWTDDPSATAAQALAASDAALRLNDDDAWNHCVRGWSAVYCRQFQAGTAALHRAVQVNPNSGVTHGVNAWVLAHTGDPEGAIESFEVTLRLAPQHPFIFMHTTGAAWAHFARERWDAAAQHAETAALRRPNCFSPLVVTAAVCAARNDIAAGRRATDAIRQLIPDFSIDWLRRFLPLQPDQFDRVCECLRALGIA
jgi:adenylate cyclase